MTYRKDMNDFRRDYYWSLPRIAMMAFATIVVIAALVWFVNAARFGSYAFWAPQYEAVRRDVMIESRAYGEGTIRRLYELRVQYSAASTPEAKAALRSVILHEVRAFDKDRLPADLLQFVTGLGA